MYVYRHFRTPMQQTTFVNSVAKVAISLLPQSFQLYSIILLSFIESFHNFKVVFSRFTVCGKVLNVKSLFSVFLPDLETIKSYIDSFRYGAPPHAGGGIGKTNFMQTQFAPSATGNFC